MENLEHGWLLAKETEYKGDIVGYCEECDRPIYEYDNFSKRQGVLFCQRCIELKQEMEDM